MSQRKNRNRPTTLIALTGLLEAARTASQQPPLGGAAYVRATKGKPRTTRSGPKTYGRNGPAACARRRRQMERLAAKRTHQTGAGECLPEDIFPAIPGLED